jgi:hypothetical protein
MLFSNIMSVAVGVAVTIYSDIGESTAIAITSANSSDTLRLPGFSFIFVADPS